MTTPSNDARALHELLDGIAGETAPPIQAWAKALGADSGTLDFARRHAEVVSLLVGTMQQVETLPERARIRAERYVMAWWNAVVMPSCSWANNVALHKIIDVNALDHLQSTADLIEARMEGSFSVPTGRELGDLRSLCSEWADAVAAEPDLSEPLRLNLLQDLKHVMWLIDNAEIFGVGRVTAAGQVVVGNVAIIGETLPPAKHGVWIERGKKLIKHLILLGGISQGLDVSFALAGGASEVIGELMPMEGGEPLAPGQLESDDPEEPDQV